jgi:hypothetical protein
VLCYLGLRKQPGGSSPFYELALRLCELAVLTLFTQFDLAVPVCVVTVVSHRAPSEVVNVIVQAIVIQVPDKRARERFVTDPGKRNQPMHALNFVSSGLSVVLDADRCVSIVVRKRF